LHFFPQTKYNPQRQLATLQNMCVIFTNQKVGQRTNNEQSDTMNEISLKKQAIEDEQEMQDAHSHSTGNLDAENDVLQSNQRTLVFKLRWYESMIAMEDRKRLMEKTRVVK